MRVAPPPGDALASRRQCAHRQCHPPAQWRPPGRCPCRPRQSPICRKPPPTRCRRDSQLGDATADAAHHSVPGRRAGGAMRTALRQTARARAALSSRSLPNGRRRRQTVVRCSCSMSQTLRVVRPPQCTSSASSRRQASQSRRGRCRSRSRANSIRYFFPGDRDEAEALRASLEGQLPGGAALSVMDFSSFEPKPQEGHLEVWLRS